MDRAAGNLLFHRRRAGADRIRATGLQVDEKKMRANLDLTKGLIVSEAVMMGLGPHLGRQYAHDLVYDVCRKVVATGRPLVDLLAENAEITKHLDRAALAEALRSGELSRRSRRDGRSRAGDAGQIVYGICRPQLRQPAHDVCATRLHSAAACSRTNFRWPIDQPCRSRAAAIVEHDDSAGNISSAACLLRA